MSAAEPSKRITNTIPSTMTEIRSYNGLPVGYKRLNFLESTGDQYIDTDWCKNGVSKIKVELDAEFVSNGYMYSYGFSVCTGANHSVMAIGRAYENTVVFLPDYVGSALWRKVSVADSLVGRHTIMISNDTSVIKDKTYVVLDGETYTTNAQGAVSGRWLFTHPAPVRLFASLTDLTGLTYYACCRIYSVKIWEEGVLTHEAYPFLAMNGQPCMYDVVTHKSYFASSQSGFSKWG